MNPEMTVNNFLDGAMNIPSRDARGIVINRLLAGLALVFLTGCGASAIFDAPSSFPVANAAIGDTVESNILIRHHGSRPLSFFRFEIDLSDEYQLNWCKVDSKTGNVSGAPKIAGYQNGRILFPNMLDLVPGVDLLLILTYAPTTEHGPSGRISMASNDPATPRLEINIRPITENGG